MKNPARFLIFTAVILFSCSGCSQIQENTIVTGGPEVIPFRALPFSLTEVKLLDGPFLHAAELDAKILLSYEPDRFLSKFCTEAGLPAKAEHYMGWEDATLAGHSLGHYLSACSMMYQTTGDNRFLERVNYIITELKRIQYADGEGYIGAFPGGKKILEEEVGKGNIRAQGFDLNGIWAPFYTQHKVMAGLRDAYHLCNNATALGVEKHFADWLYEVISPLTDEQVQEMLLCEHGGISETLADLYADTKDEKYLRLSEIFYQESFLDPLKAGQDILPGRHCNTNIPKLIALSRLYELTGDTSDRNAARFFWDRVVNHHSYVTGGNGNDEYFGPADRLRDRLGEGTTESCNVYNMLKLTEHLFEWEASAEAADFYERALFNHILATQNPQDGHVTYNLSLEMGGHKEFQDPFWFTCCIGTGIENHSKYGRNIWYHNNDELYLFQFIASQLAWKEKGVTVTQNTGYPEEQGTTLGFMCEKPVKLSLKIRYPHWAEKGIEIEVNGRKRRITGQPGSFVAISRTWDTGDKVEIKIPFCLRLEAMPDDSSRVAVMYGPLVMAGNLGPVKDTPVQDSIAIPVLMTQERDPSVWMKPVEGRVNTFLTAGTGRPADIEMRPFYTFYDRRYSVYWDMMTETGWNARLAEHKSEVERISEIADATIDFVQPGDMRSERNHGFKGERTSPGRFRERQNRESRSGWFSYTLKVSSGTPAALMVEYWGGFPGAKTFDILINDKVIATENISGKKDGHFLNTRYDIPEEISGAASRITVTFRAHPGNMAGPVFGVRTIRD
ncbi:MAG: glycoside hydrolase family 127 protein [Bacteroidales bacterium]|nr:glycoside hydrolase family 127 protein [Bacteroidales bacterium]